MLYDNIVFGPYINRAWLFKENLNASTPYKHPSLRGGIVMGRIIGSEYKISLWHLNGFPEGSNIGSIV